jgi:hypothetical protein
MPSPGQNEKVKGALALQQQGDLEAAAERYREVLAIEPANADALHMLGVVHLRQKRYREGVDCIEQACIVGKWHDRTAFANLVRGLTNLVATLPEPVDGEARCGWVAEERARRASARAEDREPLVSILIPSYNHARYVGDALRSVFAQTYPRLELIVIDDGSTDTSAQVIERTLADCPHPHRFAARANEGAPATINEALALASGEYFNVLNSDDLFAPERIEAMVAGVHRGGAEWGFSRCAFIDDAGMPCRDDARAREIGAHFESMTDRRYIGQHFVFANPVISTGNIFAACEFARGRLGFAVDFPYVHDWAFCLEAAWQEEPVVVDADLYRYRLHETNTGSGSDPGPALEADCVVEWYCERAEREMPQNPLALCAATTPGRLALARLMHMRGVPRSPEEVRAIVQKLRDVYDDAR